MSETGKISEALKAIIRATGEPCRYCIPNNWSTACSQCIAAAILPLAEKLEQSNDSLRAELALTKATLHQKEDADKTIELEIKRDLEVLSGYNELRAELEQAKQERDHHAETLVDYKIGNDNLRAQLEQAKDELSQSKPFKRAFEAAGEKAKALHYLGEADKEIADLRAQVEQLTISKDTWMQNAAEKTLKVEQLKAIVTAPEPLEFAYKLIEQLKADKTRLLDAVDTIPAAIMLLGGPPYRLTFTESCLRAIAEVDAAMRKSQ